MSRSRPDLCDAFLDLHEHAFTLVQLLGSSLHRIREDDEERANAEAWEAALPALEAMSDDLNRIALDHIPDWSKIALPTASVPVVRRGVRKALCVLHEAIPHAVEHWMEDYRRAKVVPMLEGVREAALTTYCRLPPPDEASAPATASQRGRSGEEEPRLRITMRNPSNQVYEADPGVRVEVVHGLRGDIYVALAAPNNVRFRDAGGQPMPPPFAEVSVESDQQEAAVLLVGVRQVRALREALEAVEAAERRRWQRGDRLGGLPGFEDN